MSRKWSAQLLILATMAWVVIPAWGDNDPPHNFSAKSILCTNCHTPHNAPGGTITKVDGNANLCISCHNPTGPASPRPLSDMDQAFPGQSGTSHRFDSGPSGHVEPSPGNLSTGKIESGGAFTGRIEKTYTLRIILSGDAGLATFIWVDSQGNSGSSVTGTAVPLSDGLSATFTNGSSSPSFIAGEIWTLYVRTDLRLPSSASPDPEERRMAVRVASGKVVCSVCHDQHRQDLAPFDRNAPPWSAPGDGWLSTGVGKHYQRKTNNSDQMCKVCHSARDVQSAALGSHPVGVAVPGPGPFVTEFQTPPDLPLDGPGNSVQCSSCHRPHFASSGSANAGLGDGYILRKSIVELCFQCHVLADRAAGSHFVSPTVLWPGGQYGSSFPAHSTDKVNGCVNCHWPHGWPDDNASQDYPRLWVEQYDTADDGSDPDDAEDLCYTCHDGTPARTSIRADFLKGVNGTNIFHHPVKDSEQTPGRSVECVDCHNPHRARGDNRLAGVTGVDLAGNTVGYGTGTNRDIVQYELCFKCHGDTFNASRVRTSNKRLDFGTGAANSGYHPVTQPGRNQSTNLNLQLKGGLTTDSTIACTDCHNSNATGTTDGRVTDSTSLTQGPHGSTNALILRANFSTSYTSQGPWNNSNAALCFLCHNPTLLLGRRFSEGARTNFYQNDGKDNLHWFHLTDKQATASCLSCHFDIHSNRTASNTEYRWRVNGQWFTSTSPPANVKTHLVNFAPDVQANSVGMPRWEINTETGARSCDVRCHGGTMSQEPYQPPSGDDTSHTY